MFFYLPLKRQKTAKTGTFKCVLETIKNRQINDLFSQTKLGTSQFGVAENDAIVFEDIWGILKHLDTFLTRKKFVICDFNGLFDQIYAKNTTPWI